MIIVKCGKDIGARISLLKHLIAKLLVAATASDIHWLRGRAAFPIEPEKGPANAFGKCFLSTTNKNNCNQ